ncbi:acetyl-CoA carboxylase carboxyl transferase subunit beta [Amycolatopsis acidicola]|uniref:Multifunctional fusion protein n=1 Tax=Amycolatopsis acidicola TaxID=2596893 RepID=A0A5N0VPH8_9PSEU|nr:carboxyltransferase subunit alpha [Amycolatopsis acidicola]KAA9166521.1 acetyl-CoA carboxylase carboxyl transferase subunit beta [Amycolatopsis acidicola]
MSGPARWILCSRCRTICYAPRLARALHVCPECGFHLPLTAWQRLDLVLDKGFAEVPGPPSGDADPLEFTDTVPYPRRRAEARARTGLDEAAVCATGSIRGWPVVAVAMDFRFLGGSLGSAVGELVTRAGELALAHRIPLLMVTASGGARMQEGALSLMQMAKTAQVLGELDEAGVLTVSLVTDPTFGGVAASFATLADVVLAEPGARLGFAGPRVIEQTIRQPLPDGFQTAEFLLAHGLIDLVCPRGELRARLGELLAAGSGAVPPPDPGHGVVTDPASLPEGNAWEAVRRARDLARPSTMDFLAHAFDGFTELHGDRHGKDCPAVVGGFAWLGRTPVMVVGTQKGHDAAELSARDFGMASPAGYRKAARLMRMAAKLGIPVVTLVDTPGAHPGIEAEEGGQAMAIAENLRLMAGLPVPTVAVVTGEGGSGGALALAVADRVFLCANAVYSVISPEGCAAILWHDSAAAPRAADALALDAPRLVRLGVVDGVIPESAPDDHAGTAANLRAALSAALHELMALPRAELAARRHDRFRRFGTPVPVTP